jgi:hypothetical protein
MGRWPMHDRSIGSAQIRLGLGTLRALVACVLLLSLPACRSTFAISNEGFCADMSIADIRISSSYCEAANVHTEKDKLAASERFLEMLEVVLPEIVDAAVKAALVAAGVGAAGGVVSSLIPDGADEIPVPLPDEAGR